MNTELLVNVQLAVVAMISAGFITARIWKYFDRQPGEPWSLFLQRIREDKKRKMEIRHTMFGTRSATIKADLLTLVLLIGLAYSVVHPPVMGVLCLYVLVGFIVSQPAADAAKTEEHERLSMSDKFWFRLYFAWTWIFTLRKRT